MIFGIGTDLVEIARIEAAFARHGDRFAERILGPGELERWRIRRAHHARRGVVFLATRFAAKEAVSKALGLGIRAPMSWRSVEILNAPAGGPIVVASGPLAQFLAQRRLDLHVSLTDERTMAMATAIASFAPPDGQVDAPGPGAGRGTG